MVKTNLHNFSRSFKTIKKSALGLSCTALLTCSAQASNSWSDLAEDVNDYATQSIILPSTDFFQDISKLDTSNNMRK